MPLVLIIMISLAVAATAFATIAATILVINKSLNVRRLAVHRKILTGYSMRAAELIIGPLPDRIAGVSAGRRFKYYETLASPTKRMHNRLGRRIRELHRNALKEVLIGLARDLTGESFERLVYFFYSFGFVHEEISRLTDRRWWIRAQAARDLGLMRARRSITALTAAIEDSDADVQMQAMQALISIVGADALGAIFRLARNISPWSAIELSQVVLRYRDQSVPYLLEGLRSTDQSVVLFCIDMLAQIGFVSAVEPLREMAQAYPNVTIRARSIVALGELGDERAEGLFRTELSNPNPILRIAAIQSLQRVGSPAAVPPLLERVHSAPIQERILAARAVASTGDPGVEELKKLVGGEGRLVGKIAEQVLEERGISAGTRIR
ncbi:MAG: HEAT repeat domain-containing protein [Ignavibacteria bacterium]|nr:HEAT repeat domain-containing protein [Ignavibacteria bacterium]